MKDSAIRKAWAMPSGLACSRYSMRSPHAAAVAQQLAEPRQVLRRGDETKLPDAALDEGRQRVVNHRLVIDRLKLFAGDERQRKQPRARAASQDDAFH